MVLTPALAPISFISKRGPSRRDNHNSPATKLAERPASLVCGGWSSQGTSVASHSMAIAATSASIAGWSVTSPAWTASSRRFAPLSASQCRPPATRSGIAASSISPGHCFIRRASSVGVSRIAN